MIPVKPICALKAFRIFGDLKRVKRAGWVVSGVHLPESVADHMYRMSMLVFLITDDTINKDMLLKICLMHDVAEAIVGDITPNDPVTKEEKHQMELDAMVKITNDLEHPILAAELMQLWLDYEESRSAEAILAHQLDKYEMIAQADEYEREQNMSLPSFFESTKSSFTHPEVLSWAEELRKERNARLNVSESS